MAMVVVGMKGEEAAERIDSTEYVAHTGRVESRNKESQNDETQLNICLSGSYHTTMGDDDMKMLT